MESLAKKLGTERFDLVALNHAPVVLKFEVIKNGVILKEDRPGRVMFEINVLREYLDTTYLRHVRYEYVKSGLKCAPHHG